MKRASLVLLIGAVLAGSSPAGAASSEKWWEAYDRGVSAVESKNYDAAVTALQRSLSEMPTENAAARPRRDVIIYVPHYWLGVATFNLGDVDGALREWKTSEDQGAVQNTRYYGELREWVARAHSQKEKSSESAAADGKREASAAAGRAVSAQMDAVAAGGDRSDTYRAAQRKLQESLDIAGRAGTNIAEYRRAAVVASQARDLFAGAADEARKQKASRPVIAQKQPTAPANSHATPPPATETIAKAIQQSPVEQAKPIAPPPVTERQAAQTAAAQPPPPTATTPTRPAGGEAIAAVPTSAAKDLTAQRAGKTDASRVTVSMTTNDVHSLLESAFRMFATGDLGRSEQLLTSILASKPSGEAYLLRGCDRYTQAMLSRKPEPMLASATADFRAALDLNRSLRLDPAAFSPKLVAFFDQLKRAR
jgi:hypothetical protein